MGIAYRFSLPAHSFSNVRSFQDDVASCFEYYADLAEALDKNQKAPISVPMETFKSYVLKEAIGVVALITPWYMIILCGGHLFILLVSTDIVCKGLVSSMQLNHYLNTN